MGGYCGRENGETLGVEVVFLFALADGRSEELALHGYERRGGGVHLFVGIVEGKLIIAKFKNRAFKMLIFDGF